jgi:hypothetical protein
MENDLLCLQLTQADDNLWVANVICTQLSSNFIPENDGSTELAAIARPFGIFHGRLPQPPLETVPGSRR